MLRIARPLRAAIALGLVLAAGLAGASGAAAAARPFGVPPSGLLAFADSRLVLGTTTLAQEISQQSGTLCAHYGGPSRATGYEAAVKHWTKLIERVGGERGVRQLDRGAGSGEHAVMSAAGAEAIAGHPMAALAALLRAHQLAPQDPRVLVDAAPLLTDAGHGADALALLGRAGALKADGAKPFGADLKAMIDTNRGYALVALGEAAKAIGPLRAAVSRSPLLREAKVDLAAAEACDKQPSKAAIFLAAGGLRSNFQGDLIGGGPEGDPISAPSSDVFDLSKGRTLKLAEVIDPQTIQQGYAMRQSYPDPEAEYGGVPSWTAEQDRWQQLIQRVNTLESQWSQAATQEDPLMRRRTYDILREAEDMASEPDIAALVTREAASQKDFSDTETAAEGPTGYPVCSKIGAATGALLQDTERAQGLAGQAASLTYRRQTGLAANLSNSVAHRLILAIADQDAQGSLMQIIGLDNILINIEATWASDCQRQPAGDTTLEDGSSDMPDSSPCPFHKLASFKIFDLDFDFECEGFSVEGDIGEGWVKFFVRAKYDSEKGALTVMAGPKFGVSQLGAGKLTVRDGVYVTVGKEGVRDAGLRVEESGTVGAGPVSLSKSDSMDFSIMGIHPIDDLVDLVAPAAH
jgi:hypothetical protein